MPSRDLTIYPYDLPGGASNTDVLISLELVDSNGTPQPGYDTVENTGVVGAYTATIRSESLTLALAATEGLTPQLYWRFKAQWGTTSGLRVYTSGLIELESAGGALALPEFLSLAEIPGTITGLTADEVAAIRAANSPSDTNAFATMADVAGEDKTSSLGGDLYTNNHAIIHTSSDTDDQGDPVIPVIHGSFYVLEGSTGSVMLLAGSNSQTPPADLSDVNQPVAVVGSTVWIGGGAIKLQLPGAEVGGTLVIADVDSNGFAHLVAMPAEIPAYKISALNATDIPIPADDSTVVLVTTEGDEGPTSQELLVGAVSQYALHYDNSTGVSDGTLHVGFQINTAGGGWGAVSLEYLVSIKAGAKSQWARTSSLGVEIPTNSEIRMVARANAVSTGIDLGAYDLGATTIGLTIAGEYQTNAKKKRETTEIQISETDSDGADRAAQLATIAPGSILTCSNDGETTTWTVDSVSTTPINAVLLTVSSGAGGNKNWIDNAIFSGFVGVLAFEPVIRGTVSPQRLSASNAT